MEHNVSTDSISLDAIVNPCDQRSSQVAIHSSPASSPRHYDAYTENAPIHPSASSVDLPQSVHPTISPQLLPGGAPSANRLVTSKAFENRLSAAQNLSHNTLCKSPIILPNSNLTPTDAGRDVNLVNVAANCNVDDQVNDMPSSCA
jgi:hypothetical protein